MTKTPKAPASRASKKAAVALVAETMATAPVHTDKPRKLKLPRYKSFSLQKRIKNDKEVPSVFRLFVSAFGVLRRYWIVFLGISIIYGLLNIFLVQGFSVSGNLGEIKNSLSQGFAGNLKELATSFSTFMYLLGTSGSQLSPTAGAYQFLLTLIASLALIWAFRQGFAGIKVRIRDAFYRGMYPLVPFVLVLLVIGVQLLPFVGGFLLYSTIMKNGIAVGAIETTLWVTVFALLSILTLYLISSSLFALYIVCLPDMTPLRALRSAREIVRYRRLIVLRKLIFLPIVLFFVAALIMIPLIMYVTWLAPWTFFLMSMLFLAMIHSYVYTLYRSLL